MANPEHLAILKQGVEQWNRWRGEHPDVVPDLRGSDLARVDLREANLRDTDLRQATLHEVKLRDADLGGAHLSRADLPNADLAGAYLGRAFLSGARLRNASLRRTSCPAAHFRRAELINADLSGAALRGADLRRANLRGANLRATLLRVTNLGGADLTGAHAGRTVFSSVDLSTAIGLETVHHEGPSTIGIDTIYASSGKIPEVFLRGCGVPDEFIAYIGSMVGRPIEFYSCFISYSTKDQEFAERLHADLQDRGVRCWFAPHDIKGGRKIHAQIDEAIRLHDKLLLILSEDSMSSKWVKTEIANARAREEREHKQLLFPITLVPFEEVKKWELFDADIGDSSAREIREYFIPDFSNWKEQDSYQTAFQRLVKDLKAGASG